MCSTQVSLPAQLRIKAQAKQGGTVSSSRFARRSTKRFLGIDTEDVAPFDPSADDVIQRPRRINACFSLHEVSISQMMKRRNAQIQHRPPFPKITSVPLFQFVTICVFD